VRDHRSAGTASQSDELGRAGIRVELSWSPAVSLWEHAQLVLDEGVALQAWRRAILSDPYNVMGSWLGANVCAYHGGFYVPSPQDPDLTVVASVDLTTPTSAAAPPWCSSRLRTTFCTSAPPTSSPSSQP
jgi:hypothetical protein